MPGWPTCACSYGTFLQSPIILFEKPISECLMNVRGKQTFSKMSHVIHFNASFLRFRTIGWQIKSAEVEVWKYEYFVSMGINYVYYIVGNNAKEWISKWLFQENNARKFYENQTFLTLWYAHVRNNRLSENLACFVFLKHPFWDLFFCLITGDIWEY